jgi:hypothetical protein
LIERWGDLVPGGDVVVSLNRKQLVETFPIVVDVGEDEELHKEGSSGTGPRQHCLRLRRIETVVTGVRNFNAGERRRRGR